MQQARGVVSFLLVVTMAFLSAVSVPAAESHESGADVALQRGYRTGYSDGYMAGYRDSIDQADRSMERHSEYSKADRAYSKDYGTIDDYRDGYKQGFEAGYVTGYEKKSFDASIPSNIGRKGVMPVSYTPQTPSGRSVTDVPQAQTTEQAEVTPQATSPVQTPATENAATPSAPEPIQNKIQTVAYTPSDDPVIIIPKDTEIILELTEGLGTEKSSEGDKFTAKVVSPVEIAGATVEGHVDKIVRPGRIKRRSQLLLSFDRMIISEHRWTNFDAIMTQVMPAKGDNIKTVDPEGSAIGKSSVKGDITKVGIATGTGAGIGLFGGPVGMAVGAAVGAGIGVSAIMIERGKHIVLNPTQQIKIKTSYEAQIR